jgi:hypothetical protein
MSNSLSARRFQISLKWMFFCFGIFLCEKYSDFVHSHKFIMNGKWQEINKTMLNFHQWLYLLVILKFLINGFAFVCLSVGGSEECDRGAANALCKAPRVFLPLKCNYWTSDALMGRESSFVSLQRFGSPACRFPGEYTHSDCIDFSNLPRAVIGAAIVWAALLQRHSCNREITHLM